MRYCFMLQLCFCFIFWGVIGFCEVTATCNESKEDPRRNYHRVGSPSEGHSSKRALEQVAFLVRRAINVSILSELPHSHR